MQTWGLFIWKLNFYYYIWTLFNQKTKFMKQFIFLLLTLFVLAGFSSELKALNHQSKYKYEQVVKATLDAEFVKSPMPYEFSRCQKQVFFDTHTATAIIALSGRYCSLYQGQSVPNNVKAPLSRLINIKANE